MKYAEARSSGFPAPKVKLEDVDLPRIANEIGCHEDVVHAVMEVESGASSSDKKGRIPILFEPHVFWRNLPKEKRAKAEQTTVTINGASWKLAYQGWQHGYPSDSYPRLEAALAIDETAALKACSWGRSQILGENHKLAGYASVFDMVSGFCTDEDDHIEGMIHFIKGVKLDDDLRRIEEIAKTRTPTAADWAPVAMGYNGKGYASHNYHGRLASSYAKWMKIKDTPWDTTGALKTTEPDKNDAKGAGGVVAAPVAAGVGLWAWIKGANFGETMFIGLVLLIVVGLAYWFLLRPLIRRVIELWPMFTELSSDQLSLWSRVRMALKGMKQRLWGRLIGVTGAAAALLQGGGLIDFSNILPNIEIAKLGIDIPPYMYVPSFLVPLLVWVNGKLSATRDTTPEDLAKELVTPEGASEVAPIEDMPKSFDRAVRIKKLVRGRVSQTRKAVRRRKAA